MKLILTTLSFWIVFSGICSAQQEESEKTDYREDLRFGVKAGLNYSNVYDTKGEDFVADAKFGFASGVLLPFQLENTLECSQKSFSHKKVLKEKELH